MKSTKTKQGLKQITNMITLYIYSVYQVYTFKIGISHYYLIYKIIV